MASCIQLSSQIVLESDISMFENHSIVTLSIRAFVFVPIVKIKILYHILKLTIFLRTKLRLTSLNRINCQNDTFVISFHFPRWCGLSNRLLNLDNCLILSSLCISEIEVIIIKWNLTINLTVGCRYFNRLCNWSQSYIAIITSHDLMQRMIVYDNRLLHTIRQTDLPLHTHTYHI
jgi:hypothetical protein